MIQRLERFQPIEAGKYWKALRDFPDQAIYAGETYLIERVAYIDEELHTVYIRNHPKRYGQRVKNVEAGTHAFLLADFTSGFDYEPEGEGIRANEINGIQAELQKIQQETPPQLKLEAPTLQITSLSGLTPESLSLTRQTIEDHKQKAEQIASFYERQSNQIQKTLSQLVPYYSERAAAALASVSEVTEMAARMLSGIKSLNLYLLKGVQIETISSGQSAETGFPLTVYQAKLFMDEELCVWADVDDEFDYQDIKQFDQTLASNLAFQDQIFGTPRAVVCMAVRRRHKDYGNAWENYGANQVNQEVFLLIRDGENIYRIYSPIESHIGAKLLFPTYDSMGKHFIGIDGSEINLQDVRYVKARKTHDDESLHYKRFLILLAGLDSKGILGPFHPPGIEFISLAFQNQYLRFVSDAIGSKMLPLEKRPTATNWIKEKNKWLRSGSRVFGIWKDGFTTETAPSCVKFDRRGNEWCEYSPKDSQSLQFAFASGHQLFVNIPVEGWSRSYNNRSFNAKVLLKGTHFICLDNVTPDELSIYIHNREERSEHLEYIQLFKRAKKYLEEEAKRSESTYNQLLTETEKRVATGSSELLNQAIRSYRAMNQGRELVALATEQQNEILTHVYWLAKPPSYWEGFTGFLRISITGKNKIIGYKIPAQIDNRIFEQKEVDCVEIKFNQKGWKQVSLAPRNLYTQTLTETTLYEWPEAKEWKVEQPDPLTYAKKQILFEQVEQGIEFAKHRRLNEETISALFRRLKAYRLSSRYVENPDYFIPLGAYEKNRKIYLLGAMKLAAAALIEFGGPTLINSWFTGRYRYKESGQSHIDCAEWRLSIVEYAALSDFPFHHYKIRESRGLPNKPNADIPSFDEWIKASGLRINAPSLDNLFNRIPTKGRFDLETLQLQKAFCDSRSLWKNPEGDLYLCQHADNTKTFRRVLDDSTEQGIAPSFKVTETDSHTSIVRIS